MNENKIKIPKRTLELKTEDKFRHNFKLCDEGDKLSSIYNIEYFLFIGGFDNNSWGDKIWEPLHSISAMMIEYPEDSGIFGVKFRNNGGYDFRADNRGTRIIDYKTKEIIGWNTYEGSVPKDLENFTDKLFSAYINTISKAIEKFADIKEGKYEGAEKIFPQ